MTSNQTFLSAVIPVSRRRHYSLSAFTIIEILAVMIIISLAVTFVVVQVYNRLDSTNS